ncbi:MAG: hypothetical protein PHT33_02945, partial [bacterium]|nr:hypothetical protein [bacterium]
MKAGFYQADITPSMGMEKPGGYEKAYIDRIHDPLKVRAAVFDDGNERVALVGIDTLMIHRDTVTEIRHRVEELCGIKGNHLLIAASHTHNGGPLAGMMPSGRGEVPELINRLITEHCINLDPIYADLVVGQTVTAVCEADRRRQEALLSVGSGFEDQVAFNR